MFGRFILTFSLFSSLHLVIYGFHLHGLPPRQHLPVGMSTGTGTSTNFVDESVECISEGGSSKLLSVKVDINVVTDGNSQNIEDTLIKSKELKATNFEDDDVSCLSEGGVWSVDKPTANELSKYYQSTVPSKVKETAIAELNTILECFKIEAKTIGIVSICDTIDTITINAYNNPALIRSIIKSIRYSKLVELLQNDRGAYLETTAFLVHRIPRSELPNIQGLKGIPSTSATNSLGATAPVDLIPDCELPSTVYNESPLDKFLLSIFRSLVQAEIKWKSDKVVYLHILHIISTYRFAI